MIFFGAATAGHIYGDAAGRCGGHVHLTPEGGDFHAAGSRGGGIIGAADGDDYSSGSCSRRRYRRAFGGGLLYMALVPLYAAGHARADHEEERMIRMDSDINVRSAARFTIVPDPHHDRYRFVAPEGVPLVDALMFGNLIRECGVLERLSKAAQNELANRWYAAARHTSATMAAESSYSSIRCSYWSLACWRSY